MSNFDTWMGSRINVPDVEGYSGPGNSWDEMLGRYTAAGGTGGGQGVSDAILHSNPSGQLAWNGLANNSVPMQYWAPHLANYIKNNPQSGIAQTINNDESGWFGRPDNPQMQSLEQTYSDPKYATKTGVVANFSSPNSDPDWGAGVADLDARGLNQKADSSFGGLLKSFATEGALPFIAKGAAAIYGAGTGLESLMGGGVDPFGTGVDFSGNATNQFANSSFGSLGSDMSSLDGFSGGAAKLGDGGAFDMGGSTGFGGSTPLPQSDFMSNYFNDFNPNSGGFDGSQGGNNPFQTDQSWGTNARSLFDSAGRNLTNLDEYGNNLDSWGNTPASPTDIANQTASSAGGIREFAQQGGMPSLGDLAKKYGLEGGKALYNYLQNQRMSSKAQELGQKASNVMGQPERQPFLNEAQQIAQGNLGQGGEAIKAAVMAQAQARAAKYGYGGTENSRSDVMLAQELSKYGNDRLNALLGYTGANQSTSQTAYLAARDSMAFATQSFQGFSALAAKIGMDNSGSVGKAAEEFGSKIMSYFS